MARAQWRVRVLGGQLVAFPSLGEETTRSAKEEDGLLGDYSREVGIAPGFRTSSDALSPVRFGPLIAFGEHRLSVG